MLAAVGSIASIGTVHYRRRSPVCNPDIRVWLSERAADDDGVRDRIRSYLEAALSSVYDDVAISYGGEVSLQSEDGARPVRSGRWPLQLAGGEAGAHDLEPARDVNLLVTAGQMRQAPTGFAIPHVASVGGAQHLGSLEPPEDLAASRSYTRANFSMQVLLHEVGHALGLRHEHGHVYTDDADRTVVTPMVSAYAWDDDFEADQSRCGDAYVPRSDRRRDRRAISLQFSACARRALADYRGGVRP